MTARASESTYADDAVVDVYDHDDLQPAERLLFPKYVVPGLRILDLGVGAGRTTPHLAGGAARYVGLDYSEAMIARCRRKFPNLEFVLGDASELRFESASFDVVVFSFNGLGTLPDDAARRRCLAEVSRVLTQAGAFLFSLHNPRFLATQPALANVAAARKVWRLIYAGLQTARNLPYRLLSPAFWRHEGYLTDPALHGGLRIYVCEPMRMEAQLSGAGLALQESLAAPSPAVTSAWLVPWYYYACRKLEA